jgi:nucleotide-binding universal stress UspA family protein
MRLAVDLARRFDAKLVGVSAALAHPPVEATTAGVTDGRDRRNQIAEEFERAEKQFRTLVAEAGVKFEWRALETLPTLGLASAASSADLIVIGRAPVGVVEDEHRVVNPAGLLMRVGRPMLIAPSGASAVSARRIVVAWKDNREARRAIADALPFLKRAEVVNLVAIHEIDETPALADPAAFLATHGVKYQVESLHRNATSIKCQLVAFTERAQADLIVAGGYSDIRTGEWVFSGTTRSLIENCPVACLMSH